MQVHARFQLQRDVRGTLSHFILSGLAIMLWLYIQAGVRALFSTTLTRLLLVLLELKKQPMNSVKKSNHPSEDGLAESLLSTCIKPRNWVIFESLKAWAVGWLHFPCAWGFAASLFTLVAERTSEESLQKLPSMSWGAWAPGALEHPKGQPGSSWQGMAPPLSKAEPCVRLRTGNFFWFSFWGSADS